MSKVPEFKSLSDFAKDEIVKDIPDNEILMKVAKNIPIDDINISYESYRDCTVTLLQYASHEGLLDMVDVLLNRNADINYTDGYYYSSLACASKRGHMDIVKLLLDNNADINHTNSLDENTCIDLAAKYGNIDILKLLLDNIEELDVSIHVNCYPCFIKSKKIPKKSDGDKLKYDIVKLLLDHKVDPNTGELYGDFCLGVMASYANSDIINLVISAKADVNLSCPVWEISPLMRAVNAEKLDIVRILIDNKANINALNYRDESSTYCAVENGNIEITKLLLDNKANIDTSCICKAIINKDYDMVKLLIDNKADLTQTYRGKSFVDISKESNCSEITELLVKI